MNGFITNDNNDLMLDALGNIAMDDGIEAQRQHIVNALRLQQYEYPYKLSEGVNWLGYVLGKGANLGAWQSQMLNTVNSMDFVKKIVEWTYDIQGNNLAFSLIVETDLGQIEIKG